MLFASVPLDGWVSILVMPVGVAICFGPALLVWIAAERKDARRDDGANNP